MIILYVLEGCPYCNNALSLLKLNKIKHTKIVVENKEEIKNKYKKQSKMNTFPQIFLQMDKDNIMKIGGYTELEELLQICENIKKSNHKIDVVCNMYKNSFKK
jgi:glutaredoxin